MAPEDAAKGTAIYQFGANMAEEAVRKCITSNIENVVKKYTMDAVFKEKINKTRDELLELVKQRFEVLKQDLKNVEGPTK